MSEATDLDPAVAGKSGKKGLILGLLAAVIFGGGGFYATYSGLIGGGGKSENSANAKSDAHGGADSQIAFVALDPLVVSLGLNAQSRYLRFSAQLEVPTAYEAEVSALVPRVLDVLNGYLRAVDTRDIENPAAFGRLRAQMLRRIQVVTGRGRVRDLLITEFVLN